MAWNYGLAAAGTFITLLPLLSLPALPPPPQPREHPLKSLLAGFRFLLASPLVGGIALLGGLLTMASAVRVLYPALADNWQMSAAQIAAGESNKEIGRALNISTGTVKAHLESLYRRLEVKNRTQAAMMLNISS